MTQTPTPTPRADRRKGDTADRRKAGTSDLREGDSADRRKGETPDRRKGDTGNRREDETAGLKADIQRLAVRLDAIEAQGAQILALLADLKGVAPAVAKSTFVGKRG